MQAVLIRILDIFISLAGIIFTLPAMIVIGIVVYFDTGSPLFFQSRVGKNQKQFTLIKFRTMALNTPSVGTHLVNPESITKIGRFLRRTKLDELPQLLNVLPGHMSLVGPRPCLPNQTILIDEREQRDVFVVRPGITGLAQINDVDMSTPSKLAYYDQKMINEMSLKPYANLIFSTVLGKGRGDHVRTGTTK
jgi:lipopolysaccharide/colanic/teichoic acid biosynthesis glycosyltransferase